MKKAIRILITIISTSLLLILAVTAFLFWKYTDNTTLHLTTYHISDSKIPSQFEGFRIAQIADLHNSEFGENNANLLLLLRESRPDIIVFTGDQVDARRTDIELFLDFAKEAVEIAPCYLVHGNHEGSIVGITQMCSDLQALGVTILNNETVAFSREGAAISLLGLVEPTLHGECNKIGYGNCVKNSIKELSWDEQTYSILLAHHPEFFDRYTKQGVDLVLCGHAHGGQIRIKDQGLIAPHQGLFPDYDAGEYTMDNTTMILSRGLGNSQFPWRVNNPPELVMIELHAEST